MAYDRNDIVTAARSYLGVRFKMRGRTRAEGIDCVGLLANVARDIGMSVEDTVDYSKSPDPEMFRRMITDQTKPGSIHNLRSGSIAMFKQGVFPIHAGIVVVGGGQMSVINANLKLKQVVEQPWREWTLLLLGVREFPGV